MKALATTASNIEAPVHNTVQNEPKAESEPKAASEAGACLKPKSVSMTGSARVASRHRLALARLEEARAATALAELELEEAESCSGTDRGECSERPSRVQEWVNEQKPQITDTRTDHPEQLAALAPLATAIADAVRAATTSTIELPRYGGTPTEWMGFHAAFRETRARYTRAENLQRLRRCLHGLAKEAVASLFYADTDPEEIVRLLQVRFGRPDTLVIAEMERVRALPRLTDNPKEVCIFSSRLLNIVSVVRALNKVQYLYNPEAVRSIVDKLTPILRYRWYDYADKNGDNEPDLIKISSFLSQEAELCSRHAQAETVNTRHRSPPPTRTQRAYITSRHRSLSPTRTQRAYITSSSDAIKVCPICNKNHTIPDCSVFKSMNVNARWDKAKSLNACFRCLRIRNRIHRCKYKACAVGECRGSHHPLLHYNKPTACNEMPATTVATACYEMPATTVATACYEMPAATVASTKPTAADKAYLKVIPVTIKGPAGTRNTYALLDEGSTVTLIEDQTAQAVGASGPLEPFRIEGIGGVRVPADTSMHVSLRIAGQHSHTEHEFRARTVSKLDLSPQTVEDALVQQCEHLQDISHNLVYRQGTPTLLIGQDNWNLIVSRALRSGHRNQPVASLTDLGWVLHGPNMNTDKSHFIAKVTVHSPEDNSENRIEQMLKSFFDLDNIGIEQRRPINDPEDRALALLNNRSRRLPGGRFETCLLWKRDDVELPNNRPVALRRMLGLEKRLDNDSLLKEQYEEQMNHLVSSGYAEVAASTPKSGRVWYLPHFAVSNPSKPKPRIVLDAAARSKGVSLNDTLLTGPDLLQSLPGVLMRFRQREVAVTADIKEMFLRIGIREEDRDALRFLWRGRCRDGPPTEYRMCSVIFGAASSPTTAIYIKNRNAEDHRREYPEAADAIVNNHYMDDYLQSFDTIQEAIRVASNVQHIHRQATFHLQKWASNRPEVIKAVAPNQDSPNTEVKLQDSSVVSEKALGLVWRPRDDELAFNLNLKRANPEVTDGAKRPTKREALQIIMSLFDPLGLITPVIMPAKRLLQDTWRQGIKWDDELSDDLQRQWLEWLSHMKNLHSLSVPRCYPHYADATSLEMHVFVDASESSYVATVYWRAATPHAVHLTLAMAKGKVAPLKVTSIPRLELQAAVLGCRLARTVAASHDIAPVRRVFWSDSRTVLTWLRAGPRTFKPFVAHRVAEIEEETKVSEWRWVPTAFNVADDATRGPPNDFGRDHRWFRGPDFLYHAEESWPREPASTKTPITGEERVTTIKRVPARVADALPDATRFSSWLRLMRATARVLQFTELCRPGHATDAGGSPLASVEHDNRHAGPSAPAPPTDARAADAGAPPLAIVEHDNRHAGPGAPAPPTDARAADAGAPPLAIVEHDNRHAGPGEPAPPTDARAADAGAPPLAIVEHDNRHAGPGAPAPPTDARAADTGAPPLEIVEPADCQAISCAPTLPIGVRRAVPTTVANATTAAVRSRTRRRPEVDGAWAPIPARRPPPPVRPRARNMPPTRISLDGRLLEMAERLWWRATQEESFESDLRRLRKGEPLDRDSKLRALSIQLDTDGLIRLRSRIDAALYLPEERRNPPVLDGSAEYTKLYIAWVHRQNHHAGAETVVNEIRARLWVLRLRPTARTIVRSCIKCRILRAKPASPATGNHPGARLAHHQRAFSFIGLDYLGPYSVTVGRQHVKRYVALFTCLTTRAVHLEVAGSLTTDSAVMALRRMMARRGCPTEIRSDNGTNLRGADAELRAAALRATTDEAASHTVRWRYIPPGAPFMGGAWERLVQSIKRALAATLNERHPTEEVFFTLLLEAEYTVNNRPLTPVSTSPEDPEALTPLHFLIGGPGRVPQPGSFDEQDLLNRKRWRQSQILADMFWRRWLREYVPLLQHRREPRSKGREPQVGDIVLLVDENLPRNCWVRAQVAATHPGRDGVVRVVDVRTNNGLLQRATKKIVVLTDGGALGAPAGDCARP